MLSLLLAATPMDVLLRIRYETYRVFLHNQKEFSFLCAQLPRCRSLFLDGISGFRGLFLFRKRDKCYESIKPMAIFYCFHWSDLWHDCFREYKIYPFECEHRRMTMKMALSAVLIPENILPWKLFVSRIHQTMWFVEIMKWWELSF